METLGRAAQSEPALDKLVQSGLLDLVSQTITGTTPFIPEFSELMLIYFYWYTEYCLCVLKRRETVAADATERVAVALEFWTLLCEEWGSGASRDVLAAYLGDKSLLQLLLQALCSHSSSADGQGRLQTSRIEDAAVAFFRQFCWAHRDNSRRFAEILLGVLQPVGELLIPVSILPSCPSIFLMYSVCRLRFVESIADWIHPASSAAALARTGKDLRLRDVGVTRPVRSARQRRGPFLHDDRRASPPGLQSRKEAQVSLRQRRGQLRRTRPSPDRSVSYQSTRLFVS